MQLQASSKLVRCTVHMHRGKWQSSPPWRNGCLGIADVIARQWAVSARRRGRCEEHREVFPSSAVVHSSVHRTEIDFVLPILELRR